MKANEIMIGDWLQGFLPDTYSRVAGIMNDYRVAVYAGRAYIELPIDDLQPIPLTAEILENSGFDKREVRVVVGTKTMFVFSDDYQDTVVSEYTDSIWEVEHSSTEFSFPHTRAFVGHVHELQHVLKLCGLDIEIKL